MTKVAKVRDTTFYLWEVQWRCRVPELETTDVEYIRFFGTPSSTDNSIDKELARQWIDTMLTIAKMVDYHRRGIPVRVVKFEDTKKIYDHIENHLRAWLVNLKGSLNIGNVPVEDLIAMNDFANAVYPLARSQYKEEDSIQSSFMRAIEGLGIGSLNARLFKNSTQPEQQKGLPVQREDLAKVFKNANNGLNRWT